MTEQNQNPDIVPTKPVANKDGWDKVEIIGKILLAPILVGIIGFMVSSYQHTAANKNKEFELALSIASQPDFISTDPTIAIAREWATNLISERFGDDVPQSVLQATRSDVIANITPKEAFTMIASGEITIDQISKDPRFKNCPVNDISIVTQCVGSVLRFLASPKSISYFPDGPIDLGNGLKAEEYLLKFDKPN